MRLPPVFRLLAIYFFYVGFGPHFHEEFLMQRRTISLEELDQFEVNDAGQLFWKGKAVVLERRLTLKGWELFIASLAATGAILAGAHPYLVSLSILAK